MSKKPAGLDWDAIRADYQRRVAQEAARKLAEAPVASQAPPAASPGSGRKPRNDAYDTFDVVFRYTVERQSIASIAKALDLHRSTVYRILEREGAYEGPGKSGPPRKGRCKRDHDLEKWGRERTPEQGGGRECVKCKRMRQRGEI